METHLNILGNLCRVCTNRAQTSKEIRAKKKKYEVRAYMDHIFILFGIDISTDNASTHAEYICSECHSRIANSIKTGRKGPNEHELNLDGVYGELKQMMEDKDIWCSHVDGDCKVCAVYSQQAKPGYVKKPVPGRRKERSGNM